MVKVDPSVSQNTGVAPAWVIIAEVEILKQADRVAPLSLERRG
jgi:hypothetical protein